MDAWEAGFILSYREGNCETMGYLIAWLATILFGITGMAQTVLIVAASLPSAMLASILPLRYGLDNQYASMMVVISTLLGIVTIPIAFALAG